MSGVFGIVSKSDCINDLFYGTDYHSHMGTEFGGIAVLGEEFTRQIHNISQSQFKSKFYEEYQYIKGNKGIGVISSFDEQPIYVRSKFGEFCVVTYGLIDNADALVQDLLKKGVSFTEVSHKGAVNLTELVAKMINQGDDLIDGIEKTFSKIEGSCSLLLLNRDGVYAARDRFGYTPLVIAKREDAYAVASETSAFPNGGFKVVKYLEPGEIVLIRENGMVSKAPGRPTNQICSFLWIYTGFPASSYEGINAEIVRERCGRFLAKQDKDIEVDVVSGVPDSGTAHAIGYAMESGKPFRRPLIKYTPGYGRSYTPPSQETRDLVARMKLIAIKEIIQGNRIVICEDSIVRGTQLKNFTIHKMWDCGAKEIHVRPACPPLMFPCKFCLSTRSISELAARKAIRHIEGRDIEDISEYVNPRSKKYQKMVDWIAKDLEVTTLRYQTVDDMVEAIGLPKEQLCLYCWTGQCPKSDHASSQKKTEALCPAGT
ncbi:MAG: amidophosphoribosyltransferase [Candidatus Omnitrophica bacterium]|nr:amidophosphoribosyltransferase [Candidatus Omnitrophota bacterium]MDD5671159.1 amidophosphoribosyltransferase [Candidatus Omnitrophota bacterium]